jgi:hypothetical protein
MTVLLNVFNMNVVFRDVWNKDITLSNSILLGFVHWSTMWHKPAVVLSAGDGGLKTDLLCWSA